MKRTILEKLQSLFQRPASPERAKASAGSSGESDALSRIARKNGVRLRDLIRWNKLDGALIRPGQKLVLWKLQPRRSAPAGGCLRIHAKEIVHFLRISPSSEGPGRGQNTG